MQATNTFYDVYPQDLETWRKQGAAVIDVREIWEYVQGHIPGAINIPLSELGHRLEEVPDNVVFVCASGNRSATAAEFAVYSGYKQVANLMGGTVGWWRQGRPLEI